MAGYVWNSDYKYVVCLTLFTVILNYLGYVEGNMIILKGQDAILNSLSVRGHHHFRWYLESVMHEQASIYQKKEVVLVWRLLWIDSHKLNKRVVTTLLIFIFHFTCESTLGLLITLYNPRLFLSLWAIHCNLPCVSHPPSFNFSLYLCGWLFLFLPIFIHLHW